MAVTIRDVGAKAGVSQATAARALGGYGHVSASVRDRVQHAARELGYVPNSVARALASGITHAVGLIVGDIENPFFSAVARGMSNVLEESGHTLLLANSDEDVDRERVAIEALRARQVGGSTPEEGYRASRRVLEASGRPTALFTANNFMTLGAMRALHDLGLRMPRDVSLVGFDDLEWTTLVDPPLTVVSQPATELGEAAARLVLARLQGVDGRPRRIRLETKLIIRASCASVG